MAETAKSIQKTTALFSKDSREENVPKSINNIHNKPFILHNILLKCQEAQNPSTSANTRVSWARRPKCFLKFKQST